MLRRFVERLSRRVVLRRKWPAKYGGGHLYLSPDAMLKVWTRSAAAVDQELLQAASALVRRGDCVWDVGSNLGIFAFASAHLAGPSGEVWAIEADTWLVDLLRRSARVRTAGAPIKILAVALSRGPGIVPFNIAERGRASNFVGDGRTTAGGVRERHHMIGVSLDWLLEHAGKPSVVKIDVEGMEIEVLRGGARLLREARPRMYIEVDKARSAEATEILKAADYRFFRFNQGRLVPESAATWNTVVIPAEERSPSLCQARDPESDSAATIGLGNGFH
jgi:FkbM family methyltransferase